MRFKFYLLIIVIFQNVATLAQDWKVYPYYPPGSKISFPKDEGRHTSEPIEWWYTCGHLKGATSGKTYSYMLTYFYYPATIYDGFRIFNITEDATGAFYDDTNPVNYTSLSTTNIDIRAKVFSGGSEFWTNSRDAADKIIPFNYSLKALSANAQLSLNYNSTKRPLILGDDGYLEQGLSNYTYYYSQTNNQVAGQLILNGVSEQVTGIAWIDRQYGNFNPMSGEKYEWFQLQLSNGMDLNLWNIFTVDNIVPQTEKYRILSSYVDEKTQYTTSDFKLERLAYNWMPDSLMCYAAKWRLTSSKNQVDVVISVKNENTEVKWPFRFFEGATTITGSVNGKPVTGIGFAELLHGYEQPALTITQPAGAAFKIIEPVTWQLKNPDEGRPVLYDLAYSINNKETFSPVATALKDTFFLWKNAPVTEGDKIWFKVSAYSVDKKLNGFDISDVETTVDSSPNSSQKTKLYPNPVIDNFHLVPSLTNQNGTVEIINGSGHIIHVFKNESINNTYDARFLRPGAYFLRFEKDGTKSIVKFIKK